MKYKFKEPLPYRHQIAAIRKLVSNGYGGALLIEPRCGKTRIAIDYMAIESKRAGVKKWLIVCPARVMDVWAQELWKYSTVPYELITWDKDARKQKTPPPNGPSSLKILIVNYEAFATPGKRLSSGRRSKTTGRFAVRTRIQKWVGNDLAGCVLDESHKIGNPSGKAAVMIVSMRDMFDRRLILTGTVLRKANRVVSIYTQWKFLNDKRFADTPTSREFKEEYGRWTHHNGYPQYLGPRQHNKLRNRIHMDSYAITRREALDIPDPTPTITHVNLTTSRRIYDELAEEMIAEIRHKLEQKDVVEGILPIVQIMRLAQITGGVAKGSDTDKLYRIGREKLIAMEPFLEEAVDNDEKLVVAARFKTDLRAVAALAESRKIKTFRLWGGIPRQETDQAIRDFREYDGPAVFVVQPQAGSMGIDLSTAGALIWYSLTSSYVDYKQQSDRIALHPTAEIIHLLARNSVDEVMYATLQTDGDVARYITASPESLLRGVDLS